MKCVITGHTHGLGKHLYDLYNNRGWNVIGLSRTNGNDIKDVSSIVEQTAGADLFINCTYGDGYQVQLMEALINKVDKMVVCGSISRFEPFASYINSDYVHNKRHLARACELLSADPQTQTDILHIDITFLENPIKFDPKDPNNFSADYQIEFSEVSDVIDYWYDHPKLRQVEFRWKMTPFLVGCLNRINKTSTAMGDFIDEMRNAK